MVSRFLLAPLYHIYLLLKLATALLLQVKLLPKKDSICLLEQGDEALVSCDDLFQFALWYTGG